MSRSHASISSIARRYAAAIFAASKPAAQEALIAQNLNALAQTITNSPDLKRFVASPSVSPQVKARALVAAMKSAPTLAQKSVEMIALQGRAPLMVAIASALSAMVDKASGEVRASVTAAAKLSAADELAITAMIAKHTGKKPVIQHATDEALMGGFTVQIGSTLMDASVKRQLEILRQQLLRAA